ncbi:hypothetical protein DBZ36_00605 [Alginatibacterium sediminis]|uniref:AttH domain-containing protein n=1 Tax=Alginatibacterium sediminis TaxID=2164068 RepID=A0A420ENE7_9ALTE|nr:hypothetical protein [Alginatibacterium sediminis]RKF22181.1 hypothetical protein DBZ36_00605 [Alginatibacterium sediminis]
MKLLLSLLVVATSLLSACTSEPKSDNSPDDSMPNVAAIESAVLNLFGQLNYEQGKWYFRSCSTRQDNALEFQLLLSEKDQKVLQNFEARPAFVKLKGQFSVLEDKAVIQPNYWHFISNEVDTCRHNNQQIVAFGNEPAWNVEVNASELKYSSISRSRNLEVLEQKTAQGVTSWKLTEGNSFTISPGACYDTMAGSFFAHRAELKLDLDTFSGCGSLPINAVGKQWQGVYQSFPGDELDWHQLRLNDDWSMSWELQSRANNEAYRAQGFWYVVSVDDIDLVLLNSDGSIDKRLRMRWDGQQLSPLEDLSLGLAVLPWQQTLMRVDQPSSRPNSSGEINLPVLSAQTLVASNQYDPQVEQALQRYFKLHRTRPRGERYLWWKFDLNGDGRQEILTYLNWCNKASCELLIFEPVAGKTHQFLAKILQMPMSFELAQSSSRGWYDIIAAQKLLQFDGLSYPVSAQLSSANMAVQSSGVQFTMPSSGFKNAARLR